MGNLDGFTDALPDSKKKKRWAAYIVQVFAWWCCSWRELRQRVGEGEERNGTERGWIHRMAVCSCRVVLCLNNFQSNAWWVKGAGQGDDGRPKVLIERPWRSLKRVERETRERNTEAFTDAHSLHATARLGTSKWVRAHRRTSQTYTTTYTYSARTHRERREGDREREGGRGNMIKRRMKNGW